jgi:uncharacterized membrane protein
MTMASEIKASDDKITNGNGGPNGRPTINLLTNSEAHVLIAGVALTVSYLLWLGLKVITAPTELPALLTMTLSTAVAGRAAGILFGYSAHLSTPTILLVSAVAETAVVLIFYPLFVFSCQHLLVIKRLQKVFDHVLKLAETHRSLIRRYGPIGVFAFVLFPFWATGPVVGCVIGFLMRMPAWLNMATVLSATYVAIALWTLLLRRVNDHVSAYHPAAASVLVVIVIVFAIAGHATYQAVRKKMHKS